MKIILTGTTGFIGAEVLDQAIENPSITSIIVLSRKQLPEDVTANSKVTVKILDNFLSYPQSLLEDLEGAEACLWSLGIAGSRDLDLYRRVNLDYTIAAVKAFTELLSDSTGGKPFRFIYCSGFAAERDQEKSLWIMPAVRRIRGQIENELLKYGEQNFGRLDVWILRPAVVVSKDWTVQRLVFGLGPSIKVDVLANVMVELGTMNSDPKRILENSDLNRWTKE